MTFVVFFVGASGVRSFVCQKNAVGSRSGRQTQPFFVTILQCRSGPKIAVQNDQPGERAAAGDGGRRFAWLAVCCCCIATVLSDCGGVWMCSNGVNESILARGSIRQGLAKLFLHKQRLRKGRQSGATMAVQGLTGTLHRILSAGELALLWACSNSNLTP
jgi:hypothetical protein